MWGMRRLELGKGGLHLIPHSPLLAPETSLRVKAQAHVPLVDRYFVPRLFADEVGKELSQGFGSYLDGDPIKVVVEFSPEIRPYVVRKVWHPSQESRELPDGGVEMRIRTTGLDALKYWLLRWIPHVSVIEPEELRLEMLEALKAQLTRLEKTAGRKERAKRGSESQ